MKTETGLFLFDDINSNLSNSHTPYKVHDKCFNTLIAVLFTIKIFAVIFNENVEMLVICEARGAIHWQHSVYLILFPL